MIGLSGLSFASPLVPHEMFPMSMFYGVVPLNIFLCLSFQGIRSDCDEALKNFRAFFVFSLYLCCECTKFLSVFLILAPCFFSSFTMHSALPARLPS